MADNDNKTPREKREPQFLESRSGRLVSLSGVIERILEEFQLQHGNDSPEIQLAQTKADRLKIIRAVSDYVYAVESVQLSPDEQVKIARRVYGELFSYGPLDELIADDSLTTIMIEGAHKAAIRKGIGAELTSIEPLFDDAFHLNAIIKRLARTMDIELHDDLPFIESGLVIDGRPLGINIAFSPYTIETTIDIRLHPPEPVTFEAFVSEAVVTSKAQAFLQALIKSPHGFVVMGDTESGKTTLMSALAPLLPNADRAVVVQRTGELRVPDKMQNLVVQWASSDTAGITFSERVQEALEQSPDTLLLDEVRADEPESIAPLLKDEATPRLIWSVRGASEAKRIQSALGMLARRANPQQPEETVKTLYRRLPFIVVMKRRRGKLELVLVTEWQLSDGAEYPDLMSLMEMGWEGLELTGKYPQRDLDLPDKFWAT